VTGHGLLAGRVCAVTGGARGIGRAVCERFAEEGAAVAVCDILDDDGAAVCDGLRETGARAEYVRMDVTDAASVEAGADAIAGALGPPDVLVANAGILIQQHVLDMSQTAWHRTLDVNLTGVFHCAREFGRRMVDGARGGRILIASSMAGIVGGEFYGAYAASKFAVIGLAQSMAVELAPAGVLVNCVCPGAIQTDMIEQVIHEQATATGRTADDLRRENLAPIALGRFGEPAEVADIYVWLASDLARYVTGQRVVVDGGMLIT
jgi:NAD(P)-dependent dehydrogenase (short-subunit alcohol dehydrogenase family)